MFITVSPASALAIRFFPHASSSEVSYWSKQIVTLILGGKQIWVGYFPYTLTTFHGALLFAYGSQIVSAEYRDSADE